MTDLSRTDTIGASVITFRSEKAVGLIVQDDEASAAYHAKSERKDYHGAFLSAEQARKIATELLAYADEADAQQPPTLEELVVTFDGDRELAEKVYRKHVLKEGQ